jgi:prolipoprotein diacylglyceryl transferase
VDYAFIPSPSQSVWEIPLPFSILGIESIPLRAYALCIIAGIVAACWITEARLRKRGAPEWTVLDLAVWAVPMGIVGGRIYHLITSPDAYFGANGDPMKAFQIWNGGLGIPGAIVLGGVGVWIACRRSQVPFSMIADALAPGLPVAQAIGRLGNWFNQELYGKPTGAAWGLEISPAHQQDIPAQFRGAQAYEPTFGYELLWNFGIAGLIWQLDKRFKFGKGRAFALYVLMYGVGRFWIEGRRIDLAHGFLGLRVNEWMALAMVVGAIIYLLRVHGKRTILISGAAGGLTAVDWDSPSARSVGASQRASAGEAERIDEADVADEAAARTRDDDAPDRADQPDSATPQHNDSDPEATESDPASGSAKG